MQQEIDKFNLATDLILNTNSNIFLTGKAGTGKTTFLKSLCETCTKKKIIVAPTGIAAINAHGVTMHSFFQLPLCPFLPERHGFTSEISKEKEEVIKELELLIIDEVSMLRADMLDAIDYRLRKVRKNSLPFGGVQLLMIGDLFQLPPVAVKEELKDLKKYYSSTFFFESMALQQVGFLTIELDKIFRQEDKEFKEILNGVRDGIVSASQLALLNKRYIPGFTPAKDEHYIRLVTHNKQVDEINQQGMAEMEGEDRTYYASVKGIFSESSYPVADKLILKEGAHVMFCKNKKGEYYNGSLGIVTSMSSDTIKVKKLDDNKIIDVEPETWENIDYEVVESSEVDENGMLLSEKKTIIKEILVGSFTQFPLKLAWAITVHKSQGLTFDRAIIDVSRSFMAGQTYVALSRCRSLEGIVLSEKIGWNAIKSDWAVKRFYKTELDKFPNQEEIDDMRKTAYTDCVRRLFDMSKISNLIDQLILLLKTKLKDGNEPQKTIVLSVCDGFLNSSCRKSDAMSSEIESLIENTKAYSVNPQLQQSLVELCQYHQKNINYLLASISDVVLVDGKQRYIDDAKKMIGEIMRQLKFRQSAYDYVIRNGFNLVEIQKRIGSFNIKISNNYAVDSSSSSKVQEESIVITLVGGTIDRLKFDKTNSTVIGCDKDSIEIVIPEGVTSIGHNAFEGCSKLEKIKFSNTIIKIDNYAFKDCAALKSLKIPNSAVSVGGWSFCGCTALSSLDLGGSISWIGFEAFEGCSSLLSLRIPKSVTHIGNNAFSGCTKLTELIYEEGCENIFATKIPSLERIHIPDSVTSIADDTFAELNNLMVINVAKNNPVYKDIDGVLFSKDGKTLLRYPVGKRKQKNNK